MATGVARHPPKPRHLYILFQVTYPENFVKIVVEDPQMLKPQNIQYCGYPQNLFSSRSSKHILKIW